MEGHWDATAFSATASFPLKSLAADEALLPGSEDRAYVRAALKTGSTQRLISATGSLFGGLFLMTACDGPQSALEPAGEGAERIAALFWWMFFGAILVWSLVVGLAVYSIRLQPGAHRESSAQWWIVGGGVIFPTVVLAGLLAYGLALLPDLTASAPPGSLRVRVTGEQWWWRVRYEPASGEAVELANEVRLPVGAPVEFILESRDVVHSFWIPNLGGKVDMIPGRQTRLTLRPTREGVFRGACAEYCGLSHALMNFDVFVVDPESFEAWLDRQRDPAATPPSAIMPGRDSFFANGCGACHAIRGTRADGVTGPDLTHVGSRLTLAAGALTNDYRALHRWLAGPKRVKPGARMPAFGMLPQEELEAMAGYLEWLQ